MVVEGIHVEDIFELDFLVLSLIISCTFRILAREEDRYHDFVFLALKQTEAVVFIDVSNLLTLNS